MPVVYVRDYNSCGCTQKCPYCDYRIPRRNILAWREHMKNHINANELTLSENSYIFGGGEGLRDLPYPSYHYAYWCGYCGATYDNAASLRAHIESKHSV